MTKFNYSSNTLLNCGSGWLLGFALVAITSGCGSNNQRLTQLQNENDRLLNEYRAQRDQVAQLNEKLALAQNRLAESEKLLARQSPSPSTRLSRLNDPTSLPTTPTFGSANRGTATGSASGAGAGGLGSMTSANRPSSKPNGGAPEANAPANSAARANSPANGSTAADLYWRPMRRESP